jgi:hypothetical protein
MRLFEEVRRIDGVMDHQALQRRAMIEIILLLQGARVLTRQAEQGRDVSRHVLVDLGEEIDMMRVQRVVEVEDPVTHMAEIGFVRKIAHGRLMAWARAEGNGIFYAFRIR